MPLDLSLTLRESDLPTLSEAVKEINDELTGFNKDEYAAVVVTSAKDALCELRTSPDYAELNTYIPLEELVAYSFDCDSLYAMLDTVFTTDKPGSPSAIPFPLQDTIFGQAMSWREVLVDEIRPQLAVVGRTSRDVIQNSAFKLIRGNRVVCTVLKDL